MISHQVRHVTGSCADIFIPICDIQEWQASSSSRGATELARIFSPGYISFVMSRICLAVLLAVLGAPCRAAAQDLAPAQNVESVTPQAPSATIPPASPAAKQLDVSASTGWTDTGIDVVPGDRIIVTSQGAVKMFQGPTITPDGLTRSWRDVIRSLPLNSAGTGALIGRIGNDPAVVPFLIGARKEIAINRAGRLFLGLNFDSTERPDGVFKATIQHVRPGKAPDVQAAELKFDSSLLDQVPRRVTDQSGGKGDMINFVIIGTQDAVKQAFSDGGYVLVDRTNQEAAVHALLSTLQKQSYLEMPMSELYLFGRPQDFGFARAEPVAVVQTRHHLRIWKAPFQFQGQDVWIGAATHDIGFEKDQRNNGLTHKIDPNVDLERDFVRASLTDSGDVASSTYVLPKDAVQDARTATGGSFHSDGRVLILQLNSRSRVNNPGHRD
jgi:hypothetical protein